MREQRKYKIERRKWRPVVIKYEWIDNEKGTMAQEWEIKTRIGLTIQCLVRLPSISDDLTNNPRPKLKLHNQHQFKPNGEQPQSIYIL